MGNKRYYKEVSSDSLTEFYLHGISGGSGEHKLNSSEGFADDELKHPSLELTNSPDPKVCYRCKNVLDNLSRSCRKCYKTRRDWMPPRPTRKLRKREFSLVSSDEDENLQNPPPLSKFSNLGRIRDGKPLSDEVSSDELTDYEAERRRERLKRREYVRKVMEKAYEDTTGSNTDSENVCMVCEIRPLEAVLVHEKTAHLCVCKKCAAILDYNKERCPACGKKIHYYFTGFSHYKTIK